MPIPQIDPPAPDEYAAFYASYVRSVGESVDLASALQRQIAALVSALGQLSEEGARQRYEPGKWSIKETVGHLLDAERIFSYRLLRIARGDVTPLPGWDQDLYVQTGGFDARSIASLAAELQLARASTLTLIESLDEEALQRRGVANQYPVSARALVYILAGHAQHHLAILRDRYGLQLPAA